MTALHMPSHIKQFMRLSTFHLTGSESKLVESVVWSVQVQKLSNTVTKVAFVRVSQEQNKSSWFKS